MYSIVGLGNPGKEYSQNRHNAGYIVVDELVSNIGSSSWKKKFKGSISTGLINNKSVIFLKPSTFMNLSGESVLQIKNYLKIPTENIIVIHDDLDLSIGKIKAKFSGGNAGHKGGRLGYALFYQPIEYLQNPIKIIEIWNGGDVFSWWFNRSFD